MLPGSLAMVWRLWLSLCLANEVATSPHADRQRASCLQLSTLLHANAGVDIM